MKISAGCSKIPQKIKYIILIILTSLATLFCEKWDMKRDGIPVLRGKQSKFIFIQMKERVNQNRFKIQNIAVNERGSLL